MTSSNKKKQDQLGIPYGTACNRLRKMVMFDLVRKLGLDTCYRCGIKIKSYEDLSLDHASGWLDGENALFWDLENIVFSHLSCNSRAQRRTCWNKKEAKEGSGWCSGCQSYLPDNQFHKQRTSASGLYHYCKACRKLRKRKDRI